MLGSRPHIQPWLIVTFLGGCFWTSGTGSSSLLTIRQQAMARTSGLPALDIVLDVSEGFRLEGGTIQILPPSAVDSVKVDILTQDASKSWQATRSFEVPRESLRKVQTIQNLDVIRIDEARQLLLIRGAVPGAKGGFVTVRPAVKAKSAEGAK